MTTTCGHPTADGTPCQHDAAACPVDAHDAPPSYDPPEWVECPCGEGRATLRSGRPTTEPFTHDRTKRATIYHYRHRGCPIGGTVVAVEGEVHRRTGPLFDPERYHTPAPPVASASD